VVILTSFAIKTSAFSAFERAKPGEEESGLVSWVSCAAAGLRFTKKGDITITSQEITLGTVIGKEPSQTQVMQRPNHENL
jgi:hypothetical protein